MRFTISGGLFGLHIMVHWLTIQFQYSKCMKTSSSTSTWNHCFVVTETNSSIGERNGHKIVPEGEHKPPPEPQHADWFKYLYYLMNNYNYLPKAKRLIIGEYLPRRILGKYSPIFTEPEENN
jgi:hypothetical protein